MTDNSINARLKDLIHALRITNNAFAKSIGRSSTTVQQIVTGRSKPGFELLELIMDTYPNVNPVWLLKGHGEMFLEGTADVVKEDSDSSYLTSYLEKLEEQFKRLMNQLETKDRQIEKLMDLLGKLDLGEKTHWELVRELHQRMAA